MARPYRPLPLPAPLAPLAYTFLVTFPPPVHRALLALAATVPSNRTTGPTLSPTTLPKRTFSTYSRSQPHYLATRGLSVGHVLGLTSPSKMLFSHPTADSYPVSDHLTPNFCPETADLPF